VSRTDLAAPLASPPDRTDENGAASEADTEADPDLSDDAELPPTVPPGKTPDGVMITGALYLKCFESDGTVHKNDACDTLDVFEKRFATRLYVVDKCAREIVGGAPEGILSLGVNIDIPQKDLGFWAGPSSALENAPQIGSCVRRELAGLPIHDISAKYSRYRLFFTIAFENPEKRARKIKKLKRRGRSARVVMDHVRVRREPEDGYAFGKLSRDEEVILIQRKKEWCRVITPNDNDGWMICEALEV
jgi:hypothetical protein